MGKYYPIEVKNIMNRYILSLDSWKGWITQKDMDYIIKLSWEYHDIGKVDWSTLKDK
jgi:hypothetical protein